MPEQLALQPDAILKEPRPRLSASRATQARKKQEFLEALAQKYGVERAAQLVGVGYRTVYDWRRDDEEFAEAWEIAKDRSVDHLEDALYDRAVKHDTVAGIFLLKGARPHIYRDRYEVTGPGGGPLISVILAPDQDVP